MLQYTGVNAFKREKEKWIEPGEVKICKGIKKKEIRKKQKSEIKERQKVLDRDRKKGARYCGRVRVAVVTIHIEKLHHISKTTLDEGNTSRMPTEGLPWLLPHD